MRVEVFFCVLFFSITGKYGLLQAVQPPVTFLFKALQMNIWMGGSKVDGAVGNRRGYTFYGKNSPRLMSRKQSIRV